MVAVGLFKLLCANYSFAVSKQFNHSSSPFLPHITAVCVLVFVALINFSAFALVRVLWHSADRSSRFTSACDSFKQPLFRRYSNYSVQFSGNIDVCVC